MAWEMYLMSQGPVSFSFPNRVLLTDDYLSIACGSQTPVFKSQFKCLLSIFWACVWNKRFQWHDIAKNSNISIFWLFLVLRDRTICNHMYCTGTYALYTFTSWLQLCSAYIDLTFWCNGQTDLPWRGLFLNPLPAKSTPLLRECYI